MQSDTNSYQGEKLSGSEQFTYPSSTVTKLLESLENRYKDVEEDVLGATRIADFSVWPSEFQNG